MVKRNSKATQLRRTELKSGLKLRRHSNNKGTSMIKNGQTVRDVEIMRMRLGIGVK